MVKLAERLVKVLMKHRFQPVTVSEHEYVLEVRPYHGKLEAGFILWQVGNGQLQPLVSGHTENGHLVTAEGFALHLPAETVSLLTRLLSQAW